MSQATLERPGYGEHADQPRRRRGRRRHRTRWQKVRQSLWFRLLLLAAVVLVVLVVGQLSTARRHLERARADLVAARAAVIETRVDEAVAELDEAEQRFQQARDAARRFPGGVLRPIPLLGSPARAAGDAAAAGLEVVAAGRVMADAAAGFPTSGETAIDGADLSPFHQAAVDSGVALEVAQDRLQAASEVLGGPASAMLPQVSSPAQAMREVVDDALGQLDGAERGLTLLADLTAASTEARILVLSQDSLELRPTGGFIGSYGVLQFSGGTVELVEYDDTASLPPPDPPMEAPPDLAESLPGPWALRNANWWPDFPTSAETAQELFARQGGGRVDGVIGITEAVMADLVDVMGPLEVPGYPEPVTGEGLADRILYETTLKRPLDEPRKKFTIKLSELVFQRLFDLPADAVPDVIRAIDRSVGAADVRVWFDDPDRQRLVAGTAWDGALPRPEGDVLMLVDANMSASKANKDLTREVTYHVRRDSNGALVASLRAVYRNDGAYHEALNPYYNGFLRLYVPAGAQLLDASEGGRDDGMAPDGPYRVFSTYVVVAPESEETVTFDYLLPDDVAPDSHYQLTWIRQPGTPNDTLEAVVGGSTVFGDPGEQTLSVTHSLRRNRLTEFLRDRWVIDRLFG